MTDSLSTSEKIESMMDYSQSIRPSYSQWSDNRPMINWKKATKIYVPFMKLNETSMLCDMRKIVYKYYTYSSKFIEASLILSNLYYLNSFWYRL